MVQWEGMKAGVAPQWNSATAKFCNESDSLEDEEYVKMYVTPFIEYVSSMQQTIETTKIIGIVFCEEEMLKAQNKDGKKVAWSFVKLCGGGQRFRNNPKTEKSGYAVRRRVNGRMGILISRDESNSLGYSQMASIPPPFPVDASQASPTSQQRLFIFRAKGCHSPIVLPSVWGGVEKPFPPLGGDVPTLEQARTIPSVSPRGSAFAMNAFQPSARFAGMPDAERGGGKGGGWILGRKEAGGRTVRRGFAKLLGGDK